MPTPHPLLVLDSLDLGDLAVHQPWGEQACAVSLTVLTGQLNFLEFNSMNPGPTLLFTSLSKGPAACWSKSFLPHRSTWAAPALVSSASRGPQLPLPGGSQVIQ